MRTIRHMAALAALLVVLPMAGVVAEAQDADHANRYYQWVPDKGRATWNHTTDHRHTLYNYFWWDTSWDMELLRNDGNETLEMDYTLNDWPGLAWAFDYTGDTRGTHWDTNQPYAYRDTQASEEFGSRSFTVGTAYAEQLQPAVWYYWWVGATHNSEASRAGLSAQHGYRGSNCWMGWAACVFSDMTINAIWWQNDKPDEFQIPRDWQCRWVMPRVGAPVPCAAW